MKSESKQSILGLWGPGSALGFASLARDDKGHSRGAISRPGLANITLDEQRAQGMPGAGRTRSPGWQKKQTTPA